ncbi:response regulator [Fibrobacterota bacterium]
MKETPKAHVLIIDDEKSICIGISDLLDSYGFRAQYAMSVEQGLQALETNRDIDIILLDLNLGASMSGDEAIPIIKDKHKYVQIIMLTSHSSLDNAIDCMKKGAFDFLTKPFDERVFFGMVPNALETKKLAQLSDLYLGILVHDLKNPINNISLSLDFIKQTSMDNLTDKQKQLCANMDINIWEISNMVGNILNVTKFEQGVLQIKKKEFNVRSEVEESLKLFTAPDNLLEKKVEVTYDMPDDFSFTGDKDLYQQVLLNLVSNALRFCPKKETVDVEISALEDGSLQTSVKNLGSFIDESIREGIFTKFFSAMPENRLKPNRNYGLGLTFSQMAVEAMGGRIWVNSQEDPAETIFYFILPKQRGE